MTPELLTAVAAALTALVGAIGGLAAAIRARQKTQAEDLEVFRGELRSTRRRLEVALLHIHELRSAMSLAGIVPPPVPGDLSPGTNPPERDAHGLG